MTDLKIGRECTEQGLPCQPQKRAFGAETARHRTHNLAVVHAPEYSTKHPRTEAVIAFRAAGERHSVAKELPILPTPPSPQEGAQEEFRYTRVFCLRENSPPLRLLLDFLKSKGQVPLVPKIDPAALDEWAWVHISLGYSREHKPIEVICARDRGSYKDAFEQERQYYLDRLSAFDDVEAQVVRQCVADARFLVTTRLAKADMTDAGYDFNGWVLEFFQDNCNGMVQMDGQGFFSPKGELIVELDYEEPSDGPLVAH